MRKQPVIPSAHKIIISTTVIMCAFADLPLCHSHIHTNEWCSAVPVTKMDEVFVVGYSFFFDFLFFFSSSSFAIHLLVDPSNDCISQTSRPNLQKEIIAKM